MGRPALEALLVAGEALPLVGVVCKLLYTMKEYVDGFHESEVECQRLSVIPVEISKPSPLDYEP